MTVGIAALAERGRVIVLMADRQYTETDLSGVRSEDEQYKGALLENGWIVQWAGDATFAGAVVAQANGQFVRDTAAGTPIPADAPGLYRYLRAAYANVYSALIELDVFAPGLLDMEKYVNRTYDEATIRKVEGLVEDYQENATADLLVCGFDSAHEGQVISLTVGGGSFGEPNATIGSGARLAGSQLAWQKTRRSDRLARVVYEVFQAKSYAELNVYVGKSSDAFVMFRNGRDGIRTLSDDTKTKLGDLVEYTRQTPFREQLRDKETVRRSPPQKDWEQELRELKLGPVMKAVEAIDKVTGRRVV